MLAPYLQITKPGIIAGNLISVLGGFLLASRGSVDPLVLLLTLLGVSAIIASGCVCNNVIDRDIDALMQRTRQRALVQGQVSPVAALQLEAVLGVVGFALLWRVNPLAMLHGLVGFAGYVGM